MKYDEDDSDGILWDIKAILHEACMIRGDLESHDDLTWEAVCKLTWEDINHAAKELCYEIENDCYADWFTGLLNRKGD